MSEYIDEIKIKQGIKKVLYYKPYNSKNYVSLNLAGGNTTLVVRGIEHNVKLPNTARKMTKSEYSDDIMRYFDFIDSQYK